MTMLRGLIVSLSVVSATACGSGKAAQATVPPPANTSTTTTTPTGIVVLFEAQHLWIGNQSWWTKERSKTDGYYAEVVAGLDALGKADVPGAKVELIAYGVDAVVLWKGALRDLTGDRIGSQKDISSVPVAISVDNPDGLGPLLEENLAKGLVAVGDAFAEMRVTRKELLVLGDGRHSDEAASALSALEAENVEVHAIGVGALESDQLEGDPAGFKQLFPSGRWLESGDALVAEIDAFAVALGER